MNTLAFKQKKIQSLITKHKHFENLLNKSIKSLSIDNLVITDLKKKKLKIRDELLRLNK
jgi:hypothetical protein